MLASLIEKLLQSFSQEAKLGAFTISLALTSRGEYSQPRITRVQQLCLNKALVLFSRERKKLSKYRDTFDRPSEKVKEGWCAYAFTCARWKDRWLYVHSSSTPELMLLALWCTCWRMKEENRVVCAWLGRGSLKSDVDASCSKNFHGWFWSAWETCKPTQDDNLLHPI